MTTPTNNILKSLGAGQDGSQQKALQKEARGKNLEDTPPKKIQPPVAPWITNGSERESNADGAAAHAETGPKMIQPPVAPWITSRGEIDSSKEDAATAAESIEIPGMVNSMPDEEPPTAQGSPSKKLLNRVGSFAGIYGDKDSKPGSSKWSASGIQAKSSKFMIASARDGLFGKITQVEVSGTGAVATKGDQSDDLREGGTHDQGQAQPDQLGILMLENDEEGTVRMKDEVKVQHKTVEELEEEAERLAKKKRRGCCGITFTPFEDLPDLPEKNLLNMQTDHPLRRRCLNIAVNPYFEGFWVVCSIVHFTLALPEIQATIFMCKRLKDVESSRFQTACSVGVPFFHHFIFLGVFWSEAFIKIIGLGFWRAKFSYWTHDVYNKLDFIATLSYTVEIILIIVVGNTYSLRALRLFRLLKPISRLWLFADLEIIFHAIGSALLPMLTILSLIFFVFILLSIMGMSLFGTRSFRRKCVWADDLTLKLPEAWCWRNDNIGLSNRGSCGPFQLCSDVGNPNFNFSNFDNMFGSMISLFQAFSGDGQYQILWAGLQSEPAYRPLTYIFFIMMGFGLGHVLINVFIAVFANVFSQSRVSFKLRNEERLLQAEAALKVLDGNSTARSGASSSTTTSRSSCTSQSGNSSSESVTTSRSGSSNSRSQPSYSSSSPRHRNADQNKHFSLEEHVRMIKTREIDPLLQTYMIWFFRNQVYETLTFLIILTQAVALALDGSLCPYLGRKRECWIDETLIDITNNCNVFFMFDFIVQVLCDGSLAKHFEHGECIYNFLVTITTSTAVIGTVMGLSSSATSVLRGFAIFRLLRGCKYGALEPIWLMLVKTASSLIPIMNLTLFNTIVTLAWYMLGRILFEDTLTDVNFRSNFSNISRGYMLLFQLMTGDSWAGLMYEGMSMFCGAEGLEKCDMGYATMAALYYISYFFYGKFLFVTMFLAIILEAFSVQEFMTTKSAQEEETFLNKNDCLRIVAQFHMLPEDMVDKSMLLRAWLLLSEGGKISRQRLIAFYQINDAKAKWRFLKYTGIIRMREIARKTILFPCAHKQFLRPYPGDADFVASLDDHFVEKSIETAIEDVATAQREHIRDYMAEMVIRDMTDDAIMVAMRLGSVSSLNTVDLRDTDPLVALDILRDTSIAKRLNIEGHFDNMIQQAVLGQAPNDQSEDSNLSMIATLAGVGGPTLNSARGVHKRFAKWIRKTAVILSNSSLFDGVVLATILLSSVVLCLDTPEAGILEHQTRVLSQSIQFLLDVVCNLVFMIEALSKIFAFGLMTPLSVDYMPYLQSNSNRLDLFVLILAILQMTSVGEYIGAGTSKIIRLLKVLRPLRLMTRSEGLKKIIKALGSSVKPMIYAVLFLVVVIVVFSVTAMAFFKRKFDSCSDKGIDGSINQGKFECLGPFLPQNGIYKPRAWLEPGFGQHFDTFPSSVLVLFRCITLKWVQYYASAQDAPYDINVQPVPGQQMTTASIFFHLFILFGSFFSMNLFISFMCDAFYSIQGDDQLEEIQWMSVQKMIKDNWPKRPVLPPKNRLSGLLRTLLGSKWYKAFSAWCLMINVVFMGTAHAGQAGYYTHILEVQNTIFFGQMCLEALFALVSVGPVLYLKDSANQFDIFLITATTITIVWGEEFRTMSQVVRILRLFKFGRALSQDRIISNVFETVTVSMGQVVNIATVLMVLIMMFAVLAVQLFGLVKFQTRLGIQLNFKDFTSALRSIFQLMFGDEWHQVQDDCMITEPSCTPDIYDPNDPQVLWYKSDCGQFATGVTFFPSLLIILNYVVLNLFVGMIMNNFAYINCKDSNGVLEPDDFAKVSDTWVSKFDPKATGTIKLEDVYSLMIEIGEPLGFFGTEENIGRYLCVREELKQKLQWEEENPEKQGGWMYNWIKDNADAIYTNALAAHKLVEQEVNHQRRIVADAQEALDTLKRRYGIYTPDVVVDEEEDSWQQGEHGKDVAEETEDEAWIRTAQLEWTRKGEQEDVRSVGSSQAKMEQQDAGDEQTEDLEDMCPERNDVGETKIDSIANGLKSDRQLERDEASDDEIREEVTASAEPRDLAHDQEMIQKDNAHGETVHGSNMGLSRTDRDCIRQKAWIIGRRMGSEPDMYVESREFSTEQEQELERAEIALKQAKTELILKESAARKSGIINVGFLGNVLAVCRRIFEFFMPHQETSEMRQGHVRYLDTINALLHWNKRRNIVPGYLMEARRAEDDQVILEVAFQLVQAVILGGVLRRRRRKAKLLAKQRLKNATLDAKRLGMTFSSTRHLMANRESDRLKALHDSHATPDEVKKYIYDPDCSPHRVLCAKMCFYGIASGHELAGLAIESGNTVGDHGIFGIEPSLLEVTLHHPTMITYASHVKAIDDVKSLLDNGQLPLLMLASQVHNVQFMEEVQEMTIADLRKLLDDPNVGTVISNLETFNKGKKKQFRNIDSVPGGPGTQELMALLDESILEELDEIRSKIKQKEVENEELNVTLEETQHRMFQLRQEHDSLVSAAAKAKQAVEHPSRVRRYDPSTATHSVPQQKLQYSNQMLPKSEGGKDAHQQPGTQKANEESGTKPSSPSSKGNADRNFNTSVEARSQVEDTQQQDEKILPGKTSEQASMIANDPRKIQGQIANKKAEMARLQALLEKTRRDAMRDDGGGETPEEAESLQDKLERARKRREEKTGKQAASNSASGVMISPREEKNTPGNGKRNKLNWL